MRKYWVQRYRLFSKINEGILMDRDGWFSVTPEAIARNIAKRVVLEKNAIVVDAFAGVGGNSIQFALRGAFVIAIDLNPIRIRCAIQNAKIYGVADRINFICADFFHFAKKYRSNKPNASSPFDAVFLSPPWGGPSYLNIEVFDLNSELTPNGFEIFSAAKMLSPNIAYFLPRQTSIKQLISLAGKGASCEIEHNIFNEKIKSITAYYGNLVYKQ
uniref:Trimethylguanosine synthase n=1 Tax=Syphacia muris TaxID=451379 RepID=A0A0N5AJY3_9BILA